MAPAAAVLALLILIPGAFMGWHAHRTRSAHRDLRTTHARISGLRQVRIRSGLFTIVAVAVTLIVMWIRKIRAAGSAG